MTLSPELISMVSLFGCKINLDDNDRSCWEISSLDEGNIIKLFEKHPKQLIEFHKKYFTRIFPKGLRIDSSNYDPMNAFIAGS